MTSVTKNVPASAVDRAAATPPPAPKTPADAAPDDLINRDLSWLEFNRRVLHEAVDPRTPLLERLRFLQIFTSNLDEFFMKRVGALERMAAARQPKATRDGLMPLEHVDLIRSAVIELLQQQADCFHSHLKPALREQGIELLNWADLTDAERAEAEQFFRRAVFPILTPLAVDPGHPFPFISNLSVSLGVILQHPDRSENLFARIKVPETLPRWVRIGQIATAGTTPAQHRFLSLYDLIRNNLDDLFLEMRIVGVSLFRVTRSVEPEADDVADDDDDDVDDLRESVQQELKQRRFASVVRLEHDAQLDPELRLFLMEELELSPREVYEVPLGIAQQDCKPIFELKLPKLSYPAWTPCVPAALADPKADFFATVRSGDVLVHHPYESFHASVERFIAAAAADPNVLAIKMTLYRTDEQSPFVRTLIAAAEARKQIVCVVELKARFDEERNIQVTRALEKAGVHVVYGLVGLKTHTKTALVVRQEPDGIRCYAHIGTGNYHTQTARLYTDVGLFTADPEITGDIVELFHHLTGRSIKRDYRKLLVAPANMMGKFLELIDRETDHARAGRPAQIVAKMNSLEERSTIAKLYDAATAGVDVDLIVRGFCCLRPGVPGRSERIRVSSVVGRFLEHSRIFYFRNGARDPIDGEFYIGSADWMSRNLLGRVEVITPVSARPLRERLWEVLQITLDDNRHAWDLQRDGTYVQRVPAPGEPPRGTHQILMDLTRQRCNVIGPTSA